MTTTRNPGPVQAGPGEAEVAVRAMSELEQRKAKLAAIMLAMQQAMEGGTQTANRSEPTVSDMIEATHQGFRMDNLPAEGGSRRQQMAIELIRKAEAENEQWRFANAQRILQSLNRPSLAQRGAEAMQYTGKRRLKR